MQVSYAHLLRSGAPWATADAVALVLGAAHARADAGASGAAGAAFSSEQLFLSSAGDVSVASHEGDLPQLGTSELAALLRELLALDERRGREGEEVPGALVLTMARALGHIDLPPPTRDAFLTTLRRFGSDDRRVLAAIYWRVRGQDISEHRDSALPTQSPSDRASSPLAFGGSPGDRRTSRVTVWDLRRELRKADLRLFEALRWRRRALATMSSAAAVVLAAAGLLLLFNGPAVVFDTVATSSHVGGPAAIAHVGSKESAAPQQAARDASSRSAARTTDDVRPRDPQRARASRPAVRVTDIFPPATVAGDLFSPSFAPDGELVFHTGRQHSALMRASFGPAGAPRLATILRDDAANYHPAVSPDGEWLAFDSDRDGTRSVYLAHLDASGANKISGNGYAAVPRWSPDGRYIAFIKADPGRPHVWNVWVEEVSTGTLTQVSHHRVGQAWGASWFPDSRRLAYSVEDALRIVDLRTGRSRVVRTPRPGHLVRTPAVSPDGSRIVFQVYKDGVWLLDLRAGKSTRVLDDRSAEEFAWSPDGRRIVYHTKERRAWRVAQLRVDDTV
jgi:WD40 repeat protein